MGTGPQRQRSPFVGREHEIESLRAGLDDLASGRGRLYLVAGEPGIGKTRLLDELAHEARLRDCRVLWGRCWESGGAPAYWPWTQVLRPCLASLDSGALSVHLDLYPEVAHVVPELRARVPELEATDSGDPEQLRFRVLDAATSVLREAAQARPLVVLLDDLHCADHASLLLLRFCARELHTLPIVITGTYRNTEVARFPAAAAILPDLLRDGEPLPLRGLKPEAVASYIGALSPRDMPRETVDAVYSVTEGNPLFVSEVVRLWIAQRNQDARRGLVIPEELRGAIRQRLAPLPESVRRLLAVAAVQGREFDSTLLDGVAEDTTAGGTSSAAAIDAARAAGIVQPIAGRPHRFAFAHVLLRDVLYEDLPTAERLALHRRVAATMERAHALDLFPHLAELAHHYAQAALDGDVDKAVEFAWRAGDRAVESLAYDDAVALYERGLEALGRRRGGSRPEDALLQCELLLSLADGFWGACDLERTRQTFLRAAEVARGLKVDQQRALLARAALGFAGRQQRSHFVFDAEGVRLLEESRRLLEGTDSPLCARVLARLAYALYTQPGSYARRVGLCREAAEMARRIGDTRTLRLVLNDQRWALWGPDTIEERMQIGAELARLARPVGDSDLVVLEHTWRLVDLAELGDVAAFDAELEAFAAVVLQQRRPWFARELRRFEGMRALWLGRFDEAERCIREALELSQRVPSEDALLGYGTQMLALRIEQGRAGELEAGVHALAAQHPGLGIWPYVLLLLQVEGQRTDAVRAQLARIAPDGRIELPSEYLRLLALACLAEGCALTGDVGRATPAYDLLRPYAHHCVIVGFGFACLGSASRYLGILAATIGRRDAAVAHFEAALAVETRLAARPAVARTQLAYARLLLEPVEGSEPSAEARAHAERLLSSARAVADELGMASLVARIEAASVRTRVPPQAAAAAAPAAAPVAATPLCQLRKEGDYWTMAFAGQVFRLKHVRGLTYIDHLLRRPGEPVHVFDLIDSTAGVTMARGAPQARDAGDAGPLIDARARAEYRERVRDLRADLEDAEAANDLGRAARAREEIEALLEHLGAATGLGGRERAAASQGHRARVAVGKSIRAALSKIEAHSAGLAEHLSRAIKTGIVCSYAPDPLHPIRWDLGES